MIKNQYFIDSYFNKNYSKLQLTLVQKDRNKSISSDYKKQEIFKESKI